jgi:hypothetical protein
VRPPLALALLFLSCTRATPAPTTSAAPAAARPEANRIVIQLDRALATDQVHTGDAFSARVINAGVRQDTRVFGVVSEAHRGDQNRDPVLRLQVKWLQRGSCRVPLKARITSAEVKDVSPPPGDSYRGGAVTGAVLGGILGSWPGVVTGFSVGFTAGSIQEARKRNVDAFLAEGALLTLELEAPPAGCALPS